MQRVIDQSFVQQLRAGRDEQRWLPIHAQIDFANFNKSTDLGRQFFFVSCAYVKFVQGFYRLQAAMEIVLYQTIKLFAGIQTYHERVVMMLFPQCVSHAHNNFWTTDYDTCSHKSVEDVV